MAMVTRTDDAGREPRQTKQIILLVVLVVAIGGWWSYRHWSDDEWNSKPVTRNPSDFLATWHCLSCDHELTDRVDLGPKVCPKCRQKEMYVHFRHVCSQHGVFLVAFQYNENMDPIETKIDDDPWKPIVTETGEWNLLCPVCNGEMIPAESPRPAPTESPAGGG